jgi:surfactin synthase thioesterase subunit
VASQLWFDFFERCEPPHTWLLCLPHAGSGVSLFRPWPNLLAPQIGVVGVRLPGREARIRESPLRSVAGIRRRFVAVADWVVDRPFALFGYSMGGLLAYEFAHALRDRFQVEPAALFVAACAAPQLERRQTRLSDFADRELIDRLERLGGMPAAVLREPELLELCLPILRADLEACDNYRYRARPPLNCPIFALGGRRDSYITADDLLAWSELSCGGFDRQMFDGGHFFIHHEQSRVLQCLETALLQLVGAPSMELV